MDQYQKTRLEDFGKLQSGKFGDYPLCLGWKTKIPIKLPFSNYLPKKSIRTVLACESDIRESGMVRYDLIKDAQMNRAIKERQIRTMYESQSKLRNRSIDVNNFAILTDEKINTADRKIHALNIINDGISKKIDELNNNISEMEKFQSNIERAINEIVFYEENMKKLLQDRKSNDSPEICLDQSNVLMSMKDKIVQAENQELANSEKMHKSMITETNNTVLIELGFINDLTEREKLYTNAKHESLKWEKLLNKANDWLLVTDGEYNAVLDVILEMKNILCKRNGMEKNLKRDQVDELLDFNRSEINIISEVVKLCNESIK